MLNLFTPIYSKVEVLNQVCYFVDINTQTGSKKVWFVKNDGSHFEPFLMSQYDKENLGHVASAINEHRKYNDDLSEAPVYMLKSA
ncbi:hypothetical protein [Persicirhabdus sediminis]|uniref:Uncharacterized protein n=1 Tax=Persicirhabdus sediminis TaxID=454144 RepID=A0A8J7MER4_9BACT|nr:hypothetical protein [Persicirhabdus sediminis]MBK1792594.1 hypothetical protein [Persicirhabdus sediminis]